MELVIIYQQSQTEPAMTSVPTVFFISNHELHVELTEFQDFVFLLGKLWKVDLDHVKSHWVCNMFAGGLVDQGKGVSIFSQCAN